MVAEYISNKKQFKSILGEIRSKLMRSMVSDLKSIIQPSQPTAPLAQAFALGTLLSFIPAPILDSVLVAVILTRFKQVNRPALLAARVIWNDLVVVTLYMPGYRLGMKMLEAITFDNSALWTRIFAFALGVLTFAMAAAAISALVMFVVFSMLRVLQQATGNRSDDRSG